MLGPNPLPYIIIPTILYMLNIHWINIKPFFVLQGSMYISLRYDVGLDIHWKTATQKPWIPATDLILRPLFDIHGTHIQAFLLALFFLVHYSGQLHWFLLSSPDGCQQIFVWWRRRGGGFQWWMGYCGQTGCSDCQHSGDELPQCDRKHDLPKNYRDLM